jgi:DNA-binding CsgD family transcriptional regulator
MFDMVNFQEGKQFDHGVATDAGHRRVSLAVALFAAIAVLIGVDLAADSQTGVARGHVALEGLVMALAAVGVIALWREFLTARGLAAQLGVDLELARALAARYRADAREALQGLGEAIDSQFDRWQLTAAEREVGLLMLKGLSHREVAEIRKTSEATVRQQALMVYRKSGLANRSELSAFFLEDLLLPRTSIEQESGRAS